MPSTVDSFQPYKRTLGELLGSTSPPIRVPDYQRDYSWDKDEVTDFWSDLIAFGGNDPKCRPTGEYFLGATVLVNNGSFHLVLDGQQRLATATILLAALRDKIKEYKEDAAQQIQDQFIVFQDQFTGDRVPKLELNVFDREFFRDYIQAFPRVESANPQKRSHHLIAKAYKYFQDQIAAAWDGAGGGKKGFEWAGHVTVTLREHIVLITAVSNNEASAASIFTALNDRGIGLSTVDLIRSQILQRAHATQRPEIIQCWDEMFSACGNSVGAENLIRISWVAEHGDLKTRALYKVVADRLDAEDASTSSLTYSRQLRDDALLFRRLRDGDSEDPDLESYWLGLRHLKFNAGYALLIAANHKFSEDDQKTLAKALIALVIRHNTVCKLDRAALESEAFARAKDISAGSNLDQILKLMQVRAPDDALFTTRFGILKFPATENAVARYVLRAFDGLISATEEISIAGSDRVHVEHIYPQTPKIEDRWEKHDDYVMRLGNLTLLDRRLNEQIKNSMFPVKRDQAYQYSRLEITKHLTQYLDWSPQRVDERQTYLCSLAMTLWPQTLV